MPRIKNHQKSQSLSLLLLLLSNYEMNGNYLSEKNSAFNYNIRYKPLYSLTFVTLLQCLSFGTKCIL